MGSEKSRQESESIRQINEKVKTSIKQKLEKKEEDYNSDIRRMNSFSTKLKNK